MCILEPATESKHKGYWYFASHIFVFKVLLRVVILGIFQIAIILSTIYIVTWIYLPVYLSSLHNSRGSMSENSDGRKG